MRRYEMQTRRHARGAIGAVLGVMATLVLVVGTVAAHSQTVDPNGGDGGFVKPIARPWIQGHCRAAAPAVVSDASDGVVAFNPPTALPCSDAITNPGGQVTGP
jgi:hypothetical protein